jgi:two-component system phosphate regulon sensor histidine kinase PhoR
MKLETIHPETVIRDIMENIQLRHQHANIILRSSLGNKTIQADPFHFSNIIYNLLDNSIKYSKSDPVINISLEQNNKSIQMIFSDKGMGIPAKDLDKIFDKFYRVQGNRSTVVKGFGLGLFYIKKICLAHRWKISANSVENEGTSITIQIPQ